MKEKPICHEYADRIPDNGTSGCGGLACRRVHECMHYIQDHPTGIAGIKELTWRFSISSTLLRDRFKAEFGISLGAFLRRMRLEEARRMIEEEPGMTISEIASQVGYQNHSRFASAFTKQFGLGPSQYRRLVTCLMREETGRRSWPTPHESEV